LDNILIWMIRKPVRLQFLDCSTHGAVPPSKLVAAMDSTLQHEAVQGGVQEDSVAGKVADVEANEEDILLMLEHSVCVV
jgi:hypothetical protein